MSKYLKRQKPKPIGTILYDNREEGNGKSPWNWLQDTYGAMKKTHLKTGDYTIEKYRKLIAIERKSGLSELLNDLTTSYRPTFKRFLKRLSQFPIRVIIVEEELSYCNLHCICQQKRRNSKGRFRLTPETVRWWIAEITVGYGIPILFVSGDVGRKTILQVFETANRKAQEIK